jgi:hypothetical protein
VAKQIIHRLIDDLTGGDADETIRFAYDGIEYTIDLNEKNAAKLRKALRIFVENGVKVTPNRPKPGTGDKSRPRRRTGDSSFEDTRAGRAVIRRWAHLTGRWPELGERGRIPADVIDAYYTAGAPGN